MYFTCCKIVGVKPGSDVDVIKAAYRRAAKELHPDINESEKAHQYFIILQNAYQYLLEHPYSAEEISYLRRRMRQDQQKKATEPEPAKTYKRPNHTPLREILKQSRTARTLYIFFHFFFIFIGVYMLFSSVYDIFFHPLNEKADRFSAYFTLVSGLVFGILFTSIFSASAINYFRNR